MDQRDQTAADAAHMADSAGIAYAAEMPEIADFAESAESAKSAEIVYADSADAEAPAAPGEAAIYRAVHESPEFREIRTRYRRFVFPATAVFLLWYLLYVVLAVSASQSMTRPIAGPFNIAWLLVLMLVAELVRNCGRCTLADVLTLCMRQRPVRVAAGVSGIVVSLLYLLGQMVGAGTLVSLLLSLHSPGARAGSIVGVGVLMVVYVTVGGMKTTTWIQIVKCVLLLGGTVLLTVLMLFRSHGDVSSLMRSAAQGSGHGKAYFLPGLRFGHGLTEQLDFVSLGLALVLGTTGLAHILARFYTVHTARAARRSAMWAIGLVGAFYLMTIVLGLGAAALIGAPAIKAANSAGNTAVAQLADSLGGTVLFGVTSAVAFATILAVAAGLTMASSASFAHDLWAHAFRRAEKAPPTERQEVVVARIAAVVIGGVAIALSLYAQKLNVATLVGLAFAVAASANLPALLFTLFWGRFTTRGAAWAIWGRLVPALTLVVCSPVVFGNAAAIFPNAHFDWFRCRTPAWSRCRAGSWRAGWAR